MKATKRKLIIVLINCHKAGITIYSYKRSEMKITFLQVVLGKRGLATAMNAAIFCVSAINPVNAQVIKHDRQTSEGVNPRQSAPRVQTRITPRAESQPRINRVPEKGNRMIDQERKRTPQAVDRVRTRSATTRPPVTAERNNQLMENNSFHADLHLEVEQAKTYLNDLEPAMEAYNLERRIKNENKAVRKAESRYENLADDGAHLLKKRESIERHHF